MGDHGKSAIRAIRHTVVGILLLGTSSVAFAQGLTVLPVTIHMSPGQQAAVLTLENHEAAEVSFQIRPFVWTEQSGEEKLDPTDQILASPPLGTVAPGSAQLVRIVVRRPPKDIEGSFRILLDQIPPAAAPGTVRVALRLSIPIFVEPQARIAPHLEWRVERADGKTYLAVTNTGTRHETIRDVSVKTAAGVPVKVETRVFPYVLSSATRRWRIESTGVALANGEVLNMKATADTGNFEQSVSVVGAP